MIRLRPIALIAILLLYGSGCHRASRPPIAKEATIDRPSQESWNTRVVFSDSGSVRAILQARHVAMYEQRKETLLDSGFVVDFYNESGIHTTRLSGQKGRVDDMTRDMEAFGKVVAVSDSGTTVQTEYLKWTRADRKLRSHTYVQLTSPKERLQGTGFEADQNLRNYVIYRVSGEAEVQER